jgi:hypothetical protein
MIGSEGTSSAGRLEQSSAVEIVFATVEGLLLGNGRTA